MGRIVEAVYENGVLKPLEAPDLAENQRVVLELHDAAEDDVDAYLKLCRGVYEGLSGDEIAEVEAIALDRSHFRTRDIDV